MAAKTVIVTTHYMEEAEKLCDRVGIIDHGRVLVVGTPEQLIEEMRGLTRISFSSEIPLDTITAELTVADAWYDDNEQLNIHTHAVAETISGLHQLAESEDRPIAKLATHEPNLEELFINLTGRRIRA